MFKSKHRPLNITQYEHGRLAGMLAQHWGNEQFDRPALDQSSFVQGVALHDWHYGLVDEVAIGEASEAEWLTMVRRGVAQTFADPDTDIVTKLHLKRLLQGRDGAEIEALIAQIEAHIVSRLGETEFSRQQFEWADRITAFCDMLAFFFVFEAFGDYEQTVYAKRDSNEESRLTYSISKGGAVMVDPWPFAGPSLSGVIIAFERAGYPEKLVPQAIPYQLKPARPLN